MATTTRLLLFLTVLLLLILNAFPMTADVVITPGEWDFGVISQDTVLTKVITVHNRFDDVIEIRFVETCFCLKSDRTYLKLNPDARAMVKLTFDSLDEEGRVRKTLIVRIDRGEQEAIRYVATGEVREEEEHQVPKAASESRDTEEASPSSENPCPCDSEQTPDISEDDAEARHPMLSFVYYYSPSCSHCQKFLSKTVPRIEEELQIRILVVKRDIFDPAVYSEFSKKAAELGVDVKAFPAVLIGSSLFQGNREIDRNIISALRRTAQGIKAQSIDTSGIDAAEGRKPAAFLSAPLAGLIDGINPCAFTTIICLLTALAMAGRRRREMLLMGFCFAFSVFATYYLLGLGLFNTIRAAGVFPVVSLILKWVLFAVLIVFSGLSIYDYALIRQGRTREIVLRLPDSFKKRIQDTIKVRARSTAIIGSALVLGFLVSLFELGCTGQVYFPFIVYAVRAERQTRGYLLLLIYNIGFILPLLVIFGLTYFGFSSRKLTELFQKNMAKVKMILALFFIGLAVLTVVT